MIDDFDLESFRFQEDVEAHLAERGRRLDEYRSGRTSSYRLLPPLYVYGKHRHFRNFFR